MSKESDEEDGDIPDGDEDDSASARTKRLQEKLREAERRAAEADSLRERAVADYSVQLRQMKEEISELRQRNVAPVAAPVSVTDAFAPAPTSIGFTVPPEARPAGSRPPYKVRWYEQARTASGATMKVPKTTDEVWESVPGKDDDRLVAFALQHGPGSYDIVDSDRRFVATVTYEGQPNPSLAPAAPVPDAQRPGIGSLLKTPEERAFALYEYAEKKGDAKLMQAAASQLERLVYGGAGAGDVGSKVNEMVGLFTAFASAMGSVRSIVAPQGTAAPGTSSPELEMMKFEHQMARERLTDLRGLLPEVGKTAEKVIDKLGDRFKGPQVSQDSIKAAAEKAAAAKGTSGPALAGVRPPSHPAASQAPPAAPATASIQDGIGMTASNMDKSTVQCGGCGTAFPLPQWLEHAKAGCPKPAPAQSPPAQAKEVSQAMTDDDVRAFKDYVANMKTVTGYIVAWNDAKGDSGASPANVAGTVWVAAGLKPGARDALLKAVDVGYDKLIMRTAPFIERLILAYPAGLNQQEIQALYEALIVGGFYSGIPPNIESVAGAVKELQDHVAIQTGPQGRRWLCAFLNELAMKASKPLPHPELVKSPQGRKTL